MPSKNKVHSRNQSPTGWWIVSEIEHFISSRQKKLTPNSRTLVWENLRLIRAKTRVDAYQKAMRLGRAGRPSKTDRGEFRFAGISMLLPVYEEVEDGAEILWTDRGWMPLKRLQGLVRSKRQLPVFDDRDH